MLSARHRELASTPPTPPMADLLSRNEARLVTPNRLGQRPIRQVVTPLMLPVDTPPLVPLLTPPMVRLPSRSPAKLMSPMTAVLPTLTRCVPPRSPRPNRVASLFKVLVRVIAVLLVDPTSVVPIRLEMAQDRFRARSIPEHLGLLVTVVIPRPTPIPAP